MDQSNSVKFLLDRFLAGIFAGAVFGSFAELMFFWDGPPLEGIKLPVTGALIGALLVGEIAVVMAARELSTGCKRLAVGFLAGVVIGVLGGAFVYAPIMTSLELGNDAMFEEKFLAGNQRIGIAFGLPIGGAVGLLAGWWRRNAQ